eukprot:TRINITY_DN13407_c0_g1_i1.p1 TRINITY_DN13407_c0_g1~~TRINITY_DN13407_c0_g1_i1.p1  ORF type:complete len:230 (-),score=18.97 TRINITY_DN13407_c0_g1_i1:126-815(-)
MENWKACFISTLITIAWIRVCEFLVAKKIIPNYVSRKIVHIGSGMSFILCWSLFDSSENAHYWASSVPIVITLSVVLVGLGIVKDDATVRAMSRSGNNPRELLYGPAMYGLALVIATLVFWRTSTLGMISFTLVAVGDGLSGLLGKKFGEHKLPYNPNKSLEGTLSFFIGSAIVGFYILSFFNEYLHLEQKWPIVFVSLIGALVESLDWKEYDNAVVFIAGLISCRFFW